MSDERLSRQIEFVLEIDKLKSVLRRSYVLDAQRRENSAEHSWHVAVMALVLAEYAREPVVAMRAACMLLVHDIVEVDAGDTYCYDDEANKDKPERERAAADRLFGLLPIDQVAGMRKLWEEFEAGASRDAKFARALDRLMPLLHNYHTRGRAWKKHGVTARQVLEHNAEVSEGSEAIWQFVQGLVKDSVEKGYLAE
jgi:putative hydrolase of HD superfamily